MPSKKKPEKFAVLGPKDCWHTYGLQALTPKRFAHVVSEILNGRHKLVKSQVPNRPIG